MLEMSVGDCFSFIQNGANIKQGEVDGGYPITRIETISNNRFNRDRMGYAGITDITPYRAYVLEDGDILMSHINSVRYLGRAVKYSKYDDETIIHGMNLLRLKANREIVIPDYACLFFSSRHFREQVSRITKKSVNQASFSVADLKSVKMLIASLEEQKQIVALMSRIDGIMQTRKAEFEALDELIKARFVELSAIWERQVQPEHLYSYLEEITYGFTNPMPDSAEGPWKVTAKDVVDGHVNYDTARKTTQEAYDSLTSKSKPTIGSVLLTKDGTLGRTAIVEHDNICVNQSVAVLKANPRILPRFLEVLLRAPVYQSEMLKDAGGGTIKHIYITKVDKMEVTVPDLEEQRRFLFFVSQVDKSKLSIQASLDQLETLKQSLMQKYFG